MSYQIGQELPPVMPTIEKPLRLRVSTADNHHSFDRLHETGCRTSVGLLHCYTVHVQCRRLDVFEPVTLHVA